MVVVCLAIAVLMGTALVSAFASGSATASGDSTGGPGRIAAGTTLVPANIRRGPGTSFPIVGHLAAHSEVKVQCRAGTAARPWYRLSSPRSGAYVAGTLIRIATRPAPCS